MDKRKNEETLWQAYHVIRGMAQLQEKSAINPDDANIHAMEFSQQVIAVLGDYRPSALFELADDLDKMHSEHLFSREARERNEREVNDGDPLKFY